MDEMKKANPEEAKIISDENAELLPDEKLDEVTGGASIEHVIGIMKEDIDDIPTFG